MPRLASKTALITGAARGIGEACARLFAAEGARVIVTDINDDPGRAVAASIGPAAVYHHLDVREESDWDRVIAAILNSHHRLDILVNNAGITGIDPASGPADAEHASLASWRAVHATNLDGTFLGCRAAIRAMKSTGGGSIVNISSRSGVVGIPGAVAYASSKAGVRNHTKSVALYCAEKGYNIRCNSIHPATVITPMWDDFLPKDAAQRTAALSALASEIPLNRVGIPKDVAQLALFLASDESSFITGAEFTIDGGLLAGTAARPARASS